MIKSYTKPTPMEIIGDKVKLRDNITEHVEEDNIISYTYDERELSVQEYIAIQQEKIINVENAIMDLIEMGGII